MNIKKLVLSVLVVGSSSYLSGCTIGSSESECPGIEKGVICKGPREVMELTNTRDDLSGLAGEETGMGKEKSTVNDSLYPTQITPPGGIQYPKSSVLINKPVSYTTTQVKPVSQVPVMYDETLKMGAPALTIGPRPISGVPVNSNVQITTSYSSSSGSVNPFLHPTAEVVKQTSQVVTPAPAPRYVAPNSDIRASQDLYSLNNGQPVNPSLSPGQVQQYRSQGYKQAVVAPEPLAVLQQGRVMRITFAPYTDDNDALNLPGFVYVNVKPQTWIAGKNSTSNPARIVPLEVQDTARENMQQQQRATKAVSANGIVRQL
ncbi:TraV family lipoprotein [Photorhabdus tasmaniensis]